MGCQVQTFGNFFNGSSCAMPSGLPRTNCTSYYEVRQNFWRLCKTSIFSAHVCV